MFFDNSIKILKYKQKKEEEMNTFIVVLVAIGIIFISSFLAEYVDKKEWKNLEEEEKELERRRKNL